MKKQIEVLSPAGSYESMKAAIAAGADAVYIGGNRFGARAYADNLSEEQLLEAIDYVHLHGKKIYLTINTLFKEQELKKELYDYLLPYYVQGVDAVIVQDIGVLKFVREQFPNLPVHASTQMTITSVRGAKFLEAQGVERIVTARELSLEEIREIAEQTTVEIESFVHGALCYCYSGQCLYSSMIGGRSGNRGQCAQPCRLPYKVNGSRESSYLLSLKDICTLEYIPELVEAGIDSFKIEGRMKKPEYVALVTAMYRKYTDLYFKYGKKGFHVDAKDREKLMDLYNRGGSHGGYYHMRNGREMLSVQRPNHAGVPVLKVISQNGKSVTAKAVSDIHKGDVIELPEQKENFTFAKPVKNGQNVTFSTHQKQRLAKNQILNRTRNESLLKEIQETIIEKKVKEKIDGKLFLSAAEPSRLLISYKDVTVEVIGETAQEAVSQPMDESRVEKQMRKTGNTEFEFAHFEVAQHGKLFMPMQSINALRRDGLDKLAEQIVASSRRTAPVYRTDTEEAFPEQTQRESAGFYVSVETWEQFEEVLKAADVARIYVDCNMETHIWESGRVSEMIVSAHERGKEIYFGMPHIFRADTCRIYEKHADFLFRQPWDGILIRNYESWQFLQDEGYHGNIVTDSHLYQFNKYAKMFWLERDVESTTAPLELNYRELADVGLEHSELVIYGHTPMMISAQCITKTTSGCRHQKGTLILKDRLQKEFVVKNNCDYCYNVIYNTAPTVLADQKKEIRQLMPKALRLQFTIENRAQVRKVLALYRDVWNMEGQTEEPDMEFTRGHFKRGIK